jgi:hypothetical protein
MPVLEGKELEGKIGDVGSYYIDVDAKGRAQMHIDASVNKEFIPGVKAKLELNGDVEIRTAVLVAAQAAKSSNKILQYVAKLLAAIDDGEEVHPEVVAALEMHHAAPAADAQASGEMKA